MLYEQKAIDAVHKQGSSLLYSTFTCAEDKFISSCLEKSQIKVLDGQLENRHHMNGFCRL